MLFLHVETEDQLKAVAEIKADMEEPHPMDRLLIGDVGYEDRSCDESGV